MSAIRAGLLNDAVSVYLDGSTNTAVDFKKAFNLTFTIAGGGQDVSWTTIGNKRYMAGKGASGSNARYWSKTSDYAIACWAITTDQTNIANEAVVCCNGDSAANGSGLLLRSSFVTAYRPSHLISGRSFGPEALAADANPHHLVAQVTANRVQIYRNGVFQNESATMPLSPASGFLSISFQPAAKTQIAEVLFLPRVMTAAELVWLAIPQNSLRSDQSFQLGNPL